MSSGHGAGHAAGYNKPAESEIVGRVYNTEDYLTTTKQNTADRLRHFVESHSGHGAKRTIESKLLVNEFAKQAREGHIADVLEKWIGTTAPTEAMDELAHEFSLDEKAVKKVLAPYASKAVVEANDVYIGRVANAFAQAAEEKIFEVLARKLSNKSKAEILDIANRFYQDVGRADQLDMLKQEDTEREMAGRLAGDMRRYLLQDKLAEQRALGVTPSYKPPVAHGAHEPAGAHKGGGAHH